MNIEPIIPEIESILKEWQTELGKQYTSYRNHVYRMLHFCLYLKKCSKEEKAKLYIAASFHDLGIWTHSTLDYLPPSILLAKNHLIKIQKEDWFDEISLMIDMHHKISKYKNNQYPLVELFRKGDLVDFSLGIFSCNVPNSIIKQVKHSFPNSGFHVFLLKLGFFWILRHPLNPLPIFKK